MKTSRSLLPGLLILALGATAGLLAAANPPRETALLVEIQTPIFVGGKQVGLMKLPAGTEVSVVSELPDGFLVTRSGGAPFKVAKAEITVPKAVPDPSSSPAADSAAAEKPATRDSAVAGTPFVASQPVPKTSIATAKIPILDATGVKGGLCAVVPASDGAELAALSSEGRFVVQGLAPENAVDGVREKIPASLGGLVSAQAWKAGPTLPYADNLVDLLVVDRDALGTTGPADAELLRCVSPVTGALWLRSGGAWKKLTKPMPPEYGEWSQYYYDATNNPVSRDTAVKTPTSMQWLTDNLAANGSQNQLIAAGRYLAVFNDSAGMTYTTRSAFNGIALQQAETKPDPANNMRFGPVIMADGLIYMASDGASSTPKVVARDPVTWKTVRTFEIPLPDLSKKPKDKKRGYPGRYLGISACEDVLLVWTLDKLFCADRSTGKLRWTFDGQGKNIDWPSYDPINHRVGLLLAADDTTFLMGDRDQPFAAAEVASLSLKDGGVAWQVPHPLVGVDKTPTAAFVWSGGAYYFNTNIYLGTGSFSIGCIDAATGATRWFKPNISEYGGIKGGSGSGVGSLLAYPEAVLLTRGAMVSFDPKTGTDVGQWILGNSRCDTGRGAANYFANFGHYFRVDRTAFSLVRNEVGRGNCGGNAIPAYGLHYYQPQSCGCYAAVRGLFATSSQPVADAISDEERLEKGPAFSLPPARREGPGDWPALLHDSARSAGGAELAKATPTERWRVQLEPNSQPGPIASDWRGCANFNGPISMPVAAGGLVLVTAPDAHRIHAVDAATGKKVWTFTADGRVDTPPTIAGGRVYAGSRDGYVYCLDLATGGLRWRFLAARNLKSIVAYGQPESAWPVHGSLVVEKGLVLATAGYHPDIDEGIQCWGLDAETGAVRWKRTLASERTPFALDPKIPKMPTGYFTPNKVLNAIPNSDGTVAVLPGVILSLADGSGDASLGGRDIGKQPKASIAPAITHGLMVTDWKNSPPYLRSKDGDYGGPGSPEQKQNILVAGATPALVKGSWARRAAWDAKRFVHLNSGSPDLLVFDRQSPITISWGGRGRDVEPLSEEIAGMGKILARAILNPGTVLRSSSDRDRAAMILAGDRAVIATVPTGKGVDVHLRPQATVQVVDLKTGAVVSTFEVKPGIIENGMATAQGRLFLCLDDGSLVAYE